MSEKLERHNHWVNQAPRNVVIFKLAKLIAGRTRREYNDDTFELREVLTPYGKANGQESGNTFSWGQQSPSLTRRFLHKNYGPTPDQAKVGTDFGELHSACLRLEPRPKVAHVEGSRVVADSTNFAFLQHYKNLRNYNQ